MLAELRGRRSRPGGRARTRLSFHGGLSHRVPRPGCLLVPQAEESFVISGAPISDTSGTDSHAETRPRRHVGAIALVNRAGFRACVSSDGSGWLEMWRDEENGNAGLSVENRTEMPHARERTRREKRSRSIEDRSSRSKMRRLPER